MRRLAYLLITTAVVSLLFYGATEGFSIATKICRGLRQDSSVLAGSPLLRQLCGSADEINPDQACLVDCRVDALCGNPSVGFCRAPRYHKATCDVTAAYRGSEPDNDDLPRVYRVRRGACLIATAGGRVVDTPEARRVLARFPATLACVGTALEAETALPGEWAAAFRDDARDDIAFPAGDPFASHAAGRARSLGPSARVPVMCLHESSSDPGGHDTSFPAEPQEFASRLLRARDHERQPPVMHLCARFTLPDTASARFGGELYASTMPGARESASPFTGQLLPVRAEVWLLLQIEPAAAEVTEVREVIRGSDGVTRVSRSARRRPVTLERFVEHAGTAPRLWHGMRDAAADLFG